MRSKPCKYNRLIAYWVGGYFGKLGNKEYKGRFYTDNGKM